MTAMVNGTVSPRGAHDFRRLLGRSLPIEKCRLPPLDEQQYVAVCLTF